VEYFAAAIWFAAWPTDVRATVIALDPRMGRPARRGDYSAFVMLAIVDAGTLYVEADCARRPTPEMVAAGVELCRTFRPQAIGVETNQFQELLATEFEYEFRRQGMVDVQPWSIDNRVNKQVRIRRLGPLLSTRRLRFKHGSPGTSLLVEQLRTFPVGDHDDGPDALEMAIRLAGELFAGARAGDSLGDRLPLAVA
jgi:predicted phage terminase large subunit-like protein